MTIIATSAVIKMLYASLLAGAGAAVVFSVGVFGAVRSSDMRREDRRIAAGALAVLSAVGLIASAAIVVYGLILVVHKS